MPKKNNATKPSPRASASAENEKPSAAKREPHARAKKPRSKHHAKPHRQKSAPSHARPASPKTRRRPTRVRIGEALRTHGLDEHVVAANYAQMAEKFGKDGASVTAADKIRFDLLKECSRQIEASNDAEQKAAKEKEAQRAPSPDAPVIVQLVHNVERPERPTPDPAV